MAITQSDKTTLQAKIADLSAFVNALPVEAVAPPPTSGLGMCVPSYFSSATLWAQTTADSPRVGGYMILDIDDSGPGNAVVPSYVPLVKAAQAKGVKVIGYIDTKYGAMSSITAKTFVDRYMNWYAVDGIFFDETSALGSGLAYYTDLANYVRTKPGKFVCFNFGDIPDERYMPLCDTGILFENIYSVWASWVPPAWLANYPPSKISYLVYGTTQASMANAVALAKSRNAGFVYVTDDGGANPWDRLPTYWAAEIALLG